jgi:hypothetical protein
MADPRRRLLTDALDDLGERDQLPVGRRDADPAYPSDAVDSRLRRLRGRWHLERGAAVVVGVLTTVAGLQLTAGQMPHPLLQGVIIGGGVGLAYNAARRWWSDDARARAVQLYDLLRRIDADGASPHSDTS